MNESGHKPIRVICIGQGGDFASVLGFRVDSVAVAQAIAEETQSVSELASGLERWVFKNINEKGLSVGFASAREVMITREGDCTEHAVLLAALARGAGLPSRLVTGLAFTGDAFGYHMWTEIYTDGRWVAYDGTLGTGVVPATHIAMMKSAHEDDVMGMGSLRFLDIVRNISVDFQWYRLGDGERIYTEEKD